MNETFATQMAQVAPSNDTVMARMDSILTKMENACASLTSVKDRIEGPSPEQAIAIPICPGLLGSLNRAEMLALRIAEAAARLNNQIG